MDQFSLGNRIRETRTARGLTSEALAELCGVGAVHIRKIEAGTKLPSVALRKNRKKISNYLQKKKSA